MDFNEIDIALESFIKDKNIVVSKDTHSDWLVFECRQLSWESEGINYLIEISPEFDKNEKISSWSISAAAYYDFDGKRFYINKKLAEEINLDLISKNIESLLNESYNYIKKVNKSQIPFYAELK